jgi:hypothetical protein
MIPNGPTNSHPNRFWRRVVELRVFVLTGIAVYSVMFSPGLEGMTEGRSALTRTGPPCHVTRLQ